MAYPSPSPRKRFFPPPFRLDQGGLGSSYPQGEDAGYSEYAEGSGSSGYGGSRAPSCGPSAHPSTSSRPRKRARRTQPLLFSSDLPSPALFEAGGVTPTIHYERYQSTLRLKARWEDIFERFRYAHLDDQDEIYLGRRHERMRVIRDRGVLRNLPGKGEMEFGCFIKEEEEEQPFGSEDEGDKTDGEQTHAPCDSDEDELEGWHSLLSQYPEYDSKTRPGEEPMGGQAEAQMPVPQPKPDPLLEEFLMAEAHRRAVFGDEEGLEEEPEEDEGLVMDGYETGAGYETEGGYETNFDDGYESYYGPNYDEADDGDDVVDFRDDGWADNFAASTSQHIPAPHQRKARAMSIGRASSAVPRSVSRPPIDHGATCGALTPRKRGRSVGPGYASVSAQRASSRRPERFSSPLQAVSAHDEMDMLSSPVASDTEEKPKVARPLNPPAEPTRRIKSPSPEQPLHLWREAVQSKASAMDALLRSGHFGRDTSFLASMRLASPDEVERATQALQSEAHRQQRMRDAQRKAEEAEKCLFFGDTSKGESKVDICAHTSAPVSMPAIDDALSSTAADISPSRLPPSPPRTSPEEEGEDGGLPTPTRRVVRKYGRQPATPWQRAKPAQPGSDVVTPPRSQASARASDEDEDSHLGRHEAWQMQREEDPKLPERRSERARRTVLEARALFEEELRNRTARPPRADKDKVDPTEGATASAATPQKARGGRRKSQARRSTLGPSSAASSSPLRFTSDEPSAGLVSVPRSLSRRSMLAISDSDSGSESDDARQAVPRSVSSRRTKAHRERDVDDGADDGDDEDGFMLVGMQCGGAGACQKSFCMSCGATAKVKGSSAAARPNVGLSIV